MDKLGVATAMPGISELVWVDLFLSQVTAIRDKQEEVRSRGLVRADGQRQDMENEMKLTQTQQGRSKTNLL